MKMLLKIFSVILIVLSTAQAQFYEDKRCRCICPSPAELLNSTMTNRKVFTSNVPPSKCNCEGVVLPIVGIELRGHIQEFCPRCECKYETRNTTVIMVVVIMTLWVITMLSSYMAFLMCLDPLMNSRKRGKFHRETKIGSEEARTLLLTENSED